MTITSPASLELTIVLPLGVLARQLMKVEADFRFLCLRARAYTGGENRTAREVAGHMEKINETLDSIRGLVSTFQSDMGAPPAGSTAMRKPNPDRDD